MNCKSSYFLTAERLKQFVIEGQEGGSTHECVKIINALGSGETRLIKCRQGTIGNIVKIRMTATVADSLTLCEVEVFGLQCKSNNTGRSWLNNAAPIVHHHIDKHLYKYP